MKQGSLLSGTLLVAGTTIGGGMLALPVLTSLGGFLPSIVIYLSCWLFMAGTGLLFLEISLWLHREANIVSMAETTLGKWGKAAAWILYIFLFYCLTVAYTVGCGDFLLTIFDLDTKFLGPLLFILLFGPLVIIGTRLVSSVNVAMVISMAILYFCIVFIAVPYINPELLRRSEWTLSLFSLPVSFTAFAYQGIVPTLVHYLNYDIKKIRKAILFGSFIPLITYIIWQTVILGNIPTFGPGGLAEALTKGDNAVKPLDNFINNQWLVIISNLFAFIALLTSFFGVTLGLVDFLADGLTIKKDSRGKLLLGFLVFIPPLAISFWKPDVFLQALDLAGGYGCALLLGLLPILMVWNGRYKLQLDAPYRFMGGKPLLVVMLVFVLFEVALQISISLGLFTPSL